MPHQSRRLLEVRQINFINVLKDNWKENDSLVCVGLDSEYAKLPQFLQKKYKTKAESILAFNREIINATFDLVCVFKIQYAFYGALGEEGIHALRQTINYINEKYPQIPVILDAKRGDIGNTAQAYTTEVFDIFGADAVTLNPYLGKDAFEPFLALQDKGAIFLCRTSNPGAGDFQDLQTIYEGKARPLYQVVALKIAKEWNSNDNCSLVMGATFPEELKITRDLVGDIPFLIPGIGVQGGDLEETVKNGIDSQGAGMIIHSARGIIFASQGEDFAQVARQKTLELKEEINKYRQRRK